jgi:hypothetical protein
VTLPGNLEDNPEALFVVLNYGTEDDLLEWLSAEHQREIESGRLVVYSHFETPRFRCCRSATALIRSPSERTAISIGRNARSSAVLLGLSQAVNHVLPVTHPVLANFLPAVP